MINVSITQNSRVVGALCNVSEIRREEVYFYGPDGEMGFDCIIATNDETDHYFVVPPVREAIADAVMNSIWLSVTIDRAQLNHFRGLEELAEWACPCDMQKCAVPD